MRRLLLVRHGQTEANAQGRTIAVGDPPLTEKGQQQASSLALALAGEKIDLIVTSPMLRCVQTTDVVTKMQASAPTVRVDTRLVELGMGQIEGLSREEIRAAGIEDVFVAWRQAIPPRYPEGAETFESAASRVGMIVGELRDVDADTVVLVGHSHSLRILIATIILGVNPEVHRRLFLAHATVTSVIFEETTPRLEALNAPQLLK